MNLTVHHYHPTWSNSVATLQQGRHIVHAASSSLGWREPALSLDARLFELRHDRLFEFNACPPQVPGPRARVPQDWGVSPSVDDDAEAFVLDALEEFTQVPPPSQSYAHPISCTDKVARCDSSLIGGAIFEPSTKRPRCDVASISNLIPQPHFITGPSHGFAPLDTRHLKPYRKGRASPIFPHDIPSVQAFVDNPHNRAAWLIPVRGNLPWDGATGAIILDPSQVPQGEDGPQLPSGPTALRDGTSRMTWTHRSIVAFWKFLISIQQAKNLGPISLAFHTAPGTALALENTTAESGNRSLELELDQVQESIGFSDVCCARLEAADFMKLYHEVKYSLYIRNILDAYQYIPERTTHDRSMTKIRLIKGARLVFFDNLSKAAFMI